MLLPITSPPVQFALEPTPTVQVTPSEQKTIKIKKFLFIGNTVFRSEELEKLLSQFLEKETSFSDLLKISDTITNFYVEKGYLNSGAFIPVKNNESLLINEATVTIAVVEGRLEAVNIIGDGGDRLHNYIRHRIPKANSVINSKRLLADLALLRQDRLIEKISSNLKEGTEPGKAILDVYVKPHPSFQADIFLNNYRSPVVGSFQRGVQVSQSNLLGLGDTLSVGYRNTDGSNAVTARYSLPVNPQNGTFEISYANISSTVIEQPFTSLDILANARSYDFSFRQPLIRQASATSAQEFALALTVSRLESESSLQNTPFPISAGADAEGRTRISAIRFSQDWADRSTNGALLARSQFSWGLDAFGATVNNTAPDGRFFSWLGEALWLRQLGDNSLVVKSRLQLADRPLSILEQFSLGGVNTVRGYRQDTFLSDNGFLFSTELRLSAFKTKTQELQVIPFFDFGRAWNNSNSDFSGTTGTLSSVGLGLSYRNNQFNARLDWGLPLTIRNINSNTLQENGFYFTVNYQPSF